jgi:hypothetical protein
MPLSGMAFNMFNLCCIIFKAFITALPTFLSLMFDAVLISLKICSLNSHIDFDDSMYKVTKVVPPIELLTFVSLLIVSIYNYDMILFL